VAQYQLEVKKRAIKELEKLRPDIGKKLLASIGSLASNPKPRQSHKLSGSTDSYRLRVGNYRVLYQIDNNAKIITIYQVGHRREIYR
jgi:mRNA interferase RelE/StbE